MRVLVIQLRQLGDILLTTPVLRELKEKAGAEVTVLTHRMGGPLLEKNPYKDQLLTYHEKDSLKESWQLICKLRQKHFDWVFDFMNNPRSALLCRLAKATTRVGFQGGRAFAYSLALPKGNPNQYLVKQKFSLLEAAGFQPQREDLDFIWEEKDMHPLRKWREENDIKTTKMRISLSATHRRPIRKWPAEKYIHLAEKLYRTFDAEITWLWGPGEREEVQKLQENCSVPSFLCPSTTLPELAAFLANQDLFIGNSNGPSHIATAAACPSVQLHGPTNPHSWCPPIKTHKALWHRLGPWEYQPIEDITVDAVLEKVEELKECILNQQQKRQEMGEQNSWEKAFSKKNREKIMIN